MGYGCNQYNIIDVKFQPTAPFPGPQKAPARLYIPGQILYNNKVNEGESLPDSRMQKGAVQMSLSSLGYFALLPVTAVCYYLLPARWQNLVLAAASLVFLWVNLPDGPQRLVPLAALAAVTLFTYFLALGMPRSRSKKARVALGVAGCLSLLAVFKYCNAVLPVLLGPSTLVKLAFPLGISFYSFAAISYLIDVYRGDIAPEKNLLHYFLFTGFFATITSGPICRGGQLLPQLKTPRKFSAPACGQALRLFAAGLFKKVAVSDVLALYVDQVFAGYQNHGGLSLLAAAVGYSLVLYFDFAGYSEMARASGLLLGIQLPENFKTPYFSTNFSGFWSRWHISLSSWLQDYLFMPLVWGRWTSHLPIIGKKVEKPPMISSVAMVFFLSGFWHGSTLPFVVWGLLQAAYRVGEELLHQKLGKPRKRPPAWMVWSKRAGVFCLWTLSLVFFKMGSGAAGKRFSVADGFGYLAGMVRGLSPVRFASEWLADVQAGFYAKPIMAAGWLAFVVLCLALAVWMDWQRNFRFKNKPLEQVLSGQKTAVRWAVDYAMVIAILVGLIIQSGGLAGQSFAYANF